MVAQLNGVMKVSDDDISVNFLFIQRGLKYLGAMKIVLRMVAMTHGDYSLII